MDYINVISQTPVTYVPTWIALIGGSVSILLVLSTFVYWAIVKNPQKVYKYLMIVGIIALIISFVWACITSKFYREPTGEYTYEVTLDKNNLTVAEYEEFIKRYHPTIAGDIYYFTAGELE